MNTQTGRRGWILVLSTLLAIVGIWTIGCKKEQKPAARSVVPAHKAQAKTNEQRQAKTTQPEDVNKMGQTSVKAAGPTEVNKVDATATAKVAEQTLCPVTGMPINKEIFTEYKGKKVCFCTKECMEAFKADPEKYVGKLPQFSQ